VRRCMPSCQRILSLSPNRFSLPERVSVAASPTSRYVPEASCYRAGALSVCDSHCLSPCRRTAAMLAGNSHRAASLLKRCSTAGRLPVRQLCSEQVLFMATSVHVSVCVCVRTSVRTKLLKTAHQKLMYLCRNIRHEER